MIDEDDRRRTLTDSLEEKNRAMLERVKRSGVQVIPKHLDKYNQGATPRKPGKSL